MTLAAVLLLAGCAHPTKTDAPVTPAPTGLDAETEPELRKGCDGGDLDRCAALGWHLATGTWGEKRPGDAIPPLSSACAAGSTVSCLMGLLVVRQAPAAGGAEAAGSGSRSEVEAALLDGACKTGFDAACVDLGGRATSKEAASAAWQQACGRGDQFACALDQGVWPPQGTAGAHWVGTTLAAEKPADVPAAFADVLQRGGLTFTLPAGFEAVPVEANDVFSYQFAIRSTDGSLEVRYDVAPLDTLKGKKGIDPNLVGQGLFTSALMNLSNGQTTQPQAFPALGVRVEFDADWGVVAAFAPRSAFDEHHPQGLLAVLHRDDLADVTIVALFDDPNDLAVAWEAGFHALKFSEPIGL